MNEVAIQVVLRASSGCALPLAPHLARTPLRCQPPPRGQTHLPKAHFSLMPSVFIKGIGVRLEICLSNCCCKHHSLVNI